MNEVKFEIVEQLGVLSESEKGWKKEINLVSWNDSEPRYDIRSWSPEHEKVGKGVTLTQEEFEKLKSVIKGL